MPQATLSIRVERLEQRVDGMSGWRERVDALEQQILLLRDEMRAEFSAVHAEMHARDDTIVGSLREEIRSGDEETRGVLRDEIRAGDEETRRVLLEAIRTGDEESRRFMRVLYEDLVERIKTLGEGGRRA